VGIDFYLVVGGSLFITFLIPFLGWLEKRREQAGRGEAD